MSNDERPEFEALSQLEDVLQHVAEELASWRRRALKAEAEQSALGDEGESPLAARDRLTKLESENAELRRRLDSARKRLDGLVGRLRFLEEQTAIEGGRQ